LKTKCSFATIIKTGKVWWQLYIVIIIKTITKAFPSFGHYKENRAHKKMFSQIKKTQYLDSF